MALYFIIGEEMRMRAKITLLLLSTRYDNSKIQLVSIIHIIIKRWVLQLYLIY